MYENMIRKSLFNLTSMDIDILSVAAKGYEGRACPEVNFEWVPGKDLS